MRKHQTSPNENALLRGRGCVIHKSQCHKKQTKKKKKKRRLWECARFRKDIKMRKLKEMPDLRLALVIKRNATKDIIVSLKITGIWTESEMKVWYSVEMMR